MVPSLQSRLRTLSKPGGHAPVVYLISGFRWSFFEISDVHIGVSVPMTLVFLALCMTAVWWIFRTGYRLKA